MDPKSASFDLKEVAELHNQPVNLYHSIGHIIRTKIRSGEWRIGQKIPSERALAESLNVSRATVRQGIDNLVKEGILRKEQGRGTFIAPPKLKQGVLRLLEFSDIVRESGLKPGFEFLGMEVVEPTADIADRLNLAHGKNLVWLQRLLFANDSPMLIETIYIPLPKIPQAYSTGENQFIPIDRLKCSKGVRDLLLEFFEIEIVRAIETFEPVILENNEARQLGADGGSPALWVEHLVFDIANEPVAYITVLIRGDRCRFYSDITFG